MFANSHIQIWHLGLNGVFPLTFNDWWPQIINHINTWNGLNRQFLISGTEWDTLLLKGYSVFAVSEKSLFMQQQVKLSLREMGCSVLEIEHKMPCKSQINLPRYFFNMPLFQTRIWGYSAWPVVCYFLSHLLWRSFPPSTFKRHIAQPFIFNSCSEHCLNTQNSLLHWCIDAHTNLMSPYCPLKLNGRTRAAAGRQQNEEISAANNITTHTMQFHDYSSYKYVSIPSQSFCGFSILKCLT